MDQIEEKFSRIFRYMGIPKAEARKEASFVKDFEFNEFQFNCLVVYLKNYFKINISQRDYTKLTTIGNTITFVRNKINLQAMTKPQLYDELSSVKIKSYS